MSQMYNFPIQGMCQDRFLAVKDVFCANFVERGELGAAVSVYLEGQKIVDLWGGYQNQEHNLLWQEDTIVCVLSAGKAFAALGVHILIDQGLIDLEAPVAEYWPKFGHNGKESITVRQLLAGQAGLIYLDHLPKGQIFNWNAVVKAIEDQEPVWKPGTRSAYHSSTFGHLTGELIRKVSGSTVDDFLAKWVFDPLKLDIRYGLTSIDENRASDLYPNPNSTTLNAIKDTSTGIGRAWSGMPDINGFYVNSPEFRNIVFPAGNAHTNSRSLAKLYAALACGGCLDGIRIISEKTLRQATTLQWDGACALTGRNFRYALGFFLNTPELVSMGTNPNGFGHPGAGGSIGFADPEVGLSFAYSPNRMCAGAGLGDRCEHLIETLYKVIKN
ncbi:MAG: serine hydrolase [Alphaproteobacteria bacterium]|nr:MAG: serine hydrolase [Alphaproteobacteria bacterium]